jgi:FAD/FMN-containing dehydrogenase
MSTVTSTDNVASVAIPTPSDARPVAAVGIGLVGVAIAAISLIMSTTLPWTPVVPLPAVAALAALAATFVGRGVGDYIGPTRPLGLGVLIQLAAGAGSLLLPGLPLLWAIVAGIGAGILLPPAIALLAGARRVGVATPRIVLPRRFEAPIAHRSAHRGAVVLAAVAFGLFALAWAAPTVGADWVLSAALGAAGVGLFAVGVSRAARIADPSAPAETAGALLVPGFGVFAAASLTIGLVSIVVPPLGALGAAILVLGIVVALVFLGPRLRPAVLATPGSAAYKAATAAFDATSKLAPALATVARSRADVQDAVAAARTAGIGLRAHSTGHAAGTSAAFDRDALIKVLIDEPVTVDVAAQTARIPAGTSWRDVVRAITPVGLGAAHGSSSHVGAIGYLLRGGLSAYGRTTGVAANSIVSIEVVLADGSFVTVDRDHDSELFWALRGGGGGLGVVTALTIRLFELTRVVTGTALFPAANAAELAAAWQSWTLEAPEIITTSFRLLSFPGLPGLPRVMTNTPLVVVDGTAIAARAEDIPAAEAAALGLLTRLRGIAVPVVDSWKLASPYETPNTHMDPPMGPAHTGDSVILDDRSGDAVAAFVQAADPATSGLSSLELRQLGGALARTPADGGAVASFDGDLAYWAVGMHTKTATEARVRESLATVREAIEPWSAGVVVPTFAPDASLPQRLFDSATRDRVQQVRDRVDPDGLFVRDVSAGAR